MLFWRNSKYKTPFLIISAALLVGGVLFYWRMGGISFVKNNETSSPDKTEEEQVIPDGWQTHKNTTLGIEFSYPPEWGPMEQKTEPCYFGEDNGFLHVYQDQPCRHTFLLASGLENNPLIVSSQSILFAKYGQKRSEYFGDLVTVARRQGVDIREFVSSYCYQEAGERGGVSCETETYPNGAIITKSIQGPIVESEQNKGKKLVYYIIFRPNSPYDNFIFSTEFLPDKFTSQEAEELMDKIVSTFRLMER